MTAMQSYQVTLRAAASGAVLKVYSGDNLQMKYSRILNDIGTLSLSLPKPSNWRTLFALDNFLEVERTHPVTGELQVEETYLVRETNPYRDGNDELIVVGGVALNHLIKRRVVNPADDPAQAGGYSTKAGRAEVVMRAYAREQMGDLASAARRTPGLTIPAGTGNGNTLGDRLNMENLFDKMQDFAHRSFVDFHLRRDYANQLVLDIAPMGVDRTKTTNAPGRPYLYFSPARNNLNSPSLDYDRREEATFCYVLGQGQGSARYVYPVSAVTVYDSIFNRIEFTADASNAKDNSPTTIVGAGQDALRDKRAVPSFGFQPNGIDPGTVYRADFDLGDYVTVGWDGFEVDERITAIEITLSEQDEQIAITVEPR